MRKNRSRLALLGLAALALTTIAGPGSAQAAKVSEKADGGLVPVEVEPAVGPVVSTSFVQTFKLKGKKVRKRQITDVNVTVNGTGNGPGSNRELTALLVGPKGNNAELPIPGIGSAMSNLEFDDQSILFSCPPLQFQSDQCNYLQGGDEEGTVGTMTGELNARAGEDAPGLNPVFKGGNPKGTWRLIWRDRRTFEDQSDTVATALGETTLEVRTARKFAKDDK